jgi:hypothetical protein
MEELLLQVINELKEVRKEVTICSAKIGFYKWQIGLMWTSIIGLGSMLLALSLKI